MINYRQPLLYLLLSLTLAACSQTAQDPKTVADQYWQYMQAGNIQQAEKLVSKNSQQALQQHSHRINTNTQINNGKATTIISTTITTINPNNNQHLTETFNTVLVLQQGQWKVDAKQSQIPATPDTKEKEMEQLADRLSESMKKNIDSMDDAMNQGMKLLNEAMHDGSQEMGDSLLKLMNELNDTMQQSIDKMKQRRQQQMQEQKKPQPAPQQTPPDPHQGEGMI